jgi:hypothetical protein
MHERTFYLIDVSRPTLIVFMKRVDEDLSGFKGDLA